MNFRVVLHPDLVEVAFPPVGNSDLAKPVVEALPGALTSGCEVLVEADPANALLVPLELQADALADD